MRYQVVFDLLESGYKSWSFPAFGLIFVAIGVVLLVLQRRGLLSRESMRPAILPHLILGFASLWTITTFAATYGEYRTLRQALESGRAQVIEGTVTDLTPVSFDEGQRRETFTVAGHQFTYSDYVVTAGFNQTRSHGGPLRSGSQVRVTFVGNDIVRLEVAP